MKKKVAVIGGGIAGISAAFELVKYGFDVELYEAKSNLGGRVYSLIHQQTGEVIDNGQHIMVGAYDRFFEILKEINTYNNLFIQKALKVVFYDENNKKLVLDASILPGRFGLLLGLLKMQGISVTDKLVYIYLYLMVVLNLVKPEQDVLSFLKSMHQTDRIIKVFWEPLVVATINTSLEKASAKLLVNILKLSFFANPDKAKIFIPACDFSELINPFKEWFENHSGKIFFNTSIKNVEIDNNKIDYLVDSNGNIVKADFYLFSIPSSRLQSIFKEKELFLRENVIDLNNIQSSSITSIYLWFDKKFFPDDFAAIIGKNIQWIFNRRRIMKQTSDNLPEHLTITISDSNFLSEKNQEELIKICIKEINELFPDSKSSKLLFYKVIKEKNATFLADTNTELIRPNNNTLLENLFIAGDWTNTGLPAAIESAARSGKSAAEQIISRNS